MIRSFLQDSYKDKKVFITGHTGFKGTWLVALLNDLGADVKGYALKSEHRDNIYDCINGDKLCRSVIGDIRDQQLLKKEITEFKPDFIFHLAAQPLVRVSYDMPIETYEVNVMGTAILLDAIRQLNKSCSVVIITTDKVYENKEWLFPYRETDRLGGYDPYSSSKACSELVINSFRNSFFNTKTAQTSGISIASARAGNVIGGGDWSKDRIIVDIVNALAQGQPVIVRNPTSIRPWQHVLEPLHGYLMLGATLLQNIAHYSPAYNFGPYTNDELNVEELVQTAIGVWGSGVYEIASQEEQKHEAGILKLDISQTIKHLGWMPKLNAHAAIEQTIEWYKVFFANGDLKNFTFNQIREYQKL